MEMVLNDLQRLINVYKEPFKIGKRNLEHLQALKSGLEISLRSVSIQRYSVLVTDILFFTFTLFIKLCFHTS